MASSKLALSHHSLNPRFGVRGMKFSFPSGEFAVRSALATVLEGLKHLEMTTEESGTVELVLAEVLNNVVEHAYGSASPGRIEVTCTPATDGLHFGIIDEGREMPDGQTPMGVCADVNVPLDAMPEGGFGWFLIHDLTKELAYQRVGSQNILTFRLPVAMQ